MVQRLVHVVQVALDHVKLATHGNCVLVRVGGLLSLSIGDRMDTADHHVPANGRIVQVGQGEGTVKVMHWGEGTTSLQVGLLSEHLVDGPCDGGVGRPDEAVLRRGGRKHCVEILDQGENF